MDGFFQHGLYPDWCFISTCCGKTLREKTGLSWWSDIVGRWRYPEFYLGRNVIPVCYFLLYRLLRYRFRQQPELGTGSGYGWLRWMENGYSRWRLGVYGLYLFPQNFRCACWLFAVYYADANRLYPQHSSKWHHVAWFASAHFFMALRSCHYRSTNDGLFYKLNEQRFAFIIEEIAQRKKTGNQIVATNNKQSISTVNN